MAARLTAYLVVAIVAATLIAGLIVGAQRDDSDGPVDLIVRNGTFYTADRRGTFAEAVAIRGNQILRVGSNRDIDRLRRPQTTVIDARGGAVLPGFNDSHVDLLRGGLELTRRVDLSDASNADEILERIAAWAAAHLGQQWIVGKGWSAIHFKNGVPTRQMLDSIVNDRPVLMYGASERTLTVWVNSKALKLAGITRNTADPHEGTIGREPRSREPNGFLTGPAALAVAARVPEATAQERAAALEAAMAQANSVGITSAQIAGNCADQAETFAAARRESTLTVRVYCPSLVGSDGLIDKYTVIRDEQDLASYEAFRKKYPDDPFLKAGALAIWLDNAVARHSAAMLEPYADASDDSGPLFFAPDDLNRMVRLADAAGWQVITRATGDRAVRSALNAYAHAVRSNRPPSRGRRHRLDGLGFVDTEDVSRFGPLGVLASMQPLARRTGEEDVDALAKFVGAVRARRNHPVAEIAAGTRLVLGSGWPGQALNPLLGIDRVVNVPRDESADSDAPAIQPLTLRAAIDAYTAAAAWASFDDQRKGSIAAGMLADLVVLSDDVFAAPTKLADTSVAATIFDGKIVYQRLPRSETVPAPSLQY